MSAVLKDRPMTVAEAIGKAQWYRTQREVGVDDKTAKAVIDTLLSALQRNTCYFKAVQRNEEVFVLRMHDRAAVRPIFLWSDIAEAHGCSLAKVSDARSTAGRWSMQEDIATKWPD